VIKATFSVILIYTGSIAEVVCSMRNLMRRCCEIGQHHIARKVF